ncbi:hypothetical protein OWV82_006348 [Melia azedarach]|uniref:Uncharacterized protein n=1 Tax=Melia azedarach TaxID=155640 RepID=A0ACC1YIQ8_MELAZ|nr:hypothetical protein OWV82_006348 [Melia azedarach]
MSSIACREMRSNIGRSADHVSVYIDAKLNGLAPAPPERCIFKVHHQLCSVNEEAYEPEMVAIGPYHRGKNRLQVMEEHKLRYLRRLFERRSENSIAKYVFELRGLEERARNCYAEPVNLSADEFVDRIKNLLHLVQKRGVIQYHFAGVIFHSQIN